MSEQSFNEFHPVWREWVKAYGPADGSDVWGHQGRSQRFVGGPEDGVLRQMNGYTTVYRVPLPTKPSYVSFTEPLSASAVTEASFMVTDYHERKLWPCWSAHPVRLMVWEVLFDGADDDYALDHALVSVFGMPARTPTGEARND